jgi:hypothetical protein
MECGPVPTIVIRHEEEGLEAIISISGKGHKSCTRLVRRCEDARNPQTSDRLRKVIRDIAPVSATVLCELHVAIIGSYPDNAIAERGFRDRGDGAVRDVSGDLRRIIGG